MTISTTHTRKPYIGNGSLATYPFDFMVLASSDLKVYVDGALQTLGTHYSVTGTFPGTGNVLFGASYIPAVDAVIVLQSDTPATQGTDLGAGRMFYEADVEGMSDKLTMLLQQLKNRGVFLPLGSSMAGPVLLPEPIANRYLRFNGAASGIEAVAGAADIAGVLDDVVPSSAVALFPAPGTAGRLRRATDNVRGLWLDDGVQWVSMANGMFNARSFGATGDGVTDDSAFIQAAIDAAYAVGGGVVLLPPGYVYRCINLVLKDGVVLLGSPYGIGYLPSNITRTKLLAAGAGIIVDTPVGGATGAGVVGVDLQGLGAGTAVKGIHFRGGFWKQVKNVMLNNFSDEGLLISASVADVVEDVLVVNCVLNRSQAAVIGAIDIAGTDHHIHRVEGTISGSIEGTKQSANLYCAGIVIRGTNCMLSNAIGEISDIGVYVSGNFNKFTNCRADLNYGHGFHVSGGFNQFSNSFSINNSQDTTNTYDGWYVSGLANQFMNCAAHSLGVEGGIPNVHRYGFNDQYNGDTLKNKYWGVTDYLSETAGFLNQTQGSAFHFPEGPPRIFSDGDATPSVEGYNFWTFSQTSPTTVTNFDKGVTGQRIQVWDMGTARTTIEHGTNIYTNTGANKELVPFRIYTFVYTGNFWVETE